MKTMLVAVFLASGCMAGSSTYGFRASSGPAPRRPAPRAEPPGPAYAPGEDLHWFSADDYLVTAQRFEGKPIRYLKLAKMMSPPNADTKAEARFLTADGRELWTASYFATRVAESADLVVGAIALCHQPSAFRRETSGPHDKRDARNEHWAIGPITDTSDAYKGRVAVGSLACPIAALRVPIR